MSSTLLIPHAWLPDFSGPPVDSAVLCGVAFSRPMRTSPGAPVKVLVVEDDTTIADMYRVQLEYDGYEVTVVATGQAALKVLDQGPPDIILLDLLLPDRSGLEVMVEIKQAHVSHPPVVILSNYGEPAMIERGLALGAVDYLVKSRVTPDSVSRSIPGWIERGGSGEPPRQH